MKNSKSAVSIALSMGILLSVVPAPAWADTSTTTQTALITQEKAEAIAKQAFTIPDGYRLQTKNQAIDSFVTAAPLVLQYMPVFGDTMKGYESPPTGIKLVYASIQYQGNYLDAISGTWMTPWGTPIYKNGEIKDIKGHWAEAKLQYFADKGLIQVKDGKISPDQAITKGNLINLLVASINGPVYTSDKVSFSDVQKSSAYYPAVETALYRKWIDPVKEFHPNDPFTRAQM